MKKKADPVEQIADFLEKQEDYLWPLRKVMRLLAITGISEKVLFKLLKKDKRFYTQDEKPMFDDDDEFTPEERIQEELAMEELGYFGGPRIMLHSKAPSREQLFRGMAQQLKTMNEALDNAMTARPKDDRGTEEKIKEAKARSQQLEKELAKVFEHDKKKNWLGSSLCARRS